MSEIDLHHPLDDDPARGRIERQCYHSLVTLLPQIVAGERSNLSLAILQHRADTCDGFTAGESLIAMLFPPGTLGDVNRYVVHEKLAVIEVETKPP
jgi:hypothetical protein